VCQSPPQAYPPSAERPAPPFGVGICAPGPDPSPAVRSLFAECQLAVERRVSEVATLEWDREAVLQLQRDVYTRGQPQALLPAVSALGVAVSELQRSETARHEQDRVVAGLQAELRDLREQFLVAQRAGAPPAVPAPTAAAAEASGGGPASRYESAASRYEAPQRASSLALDRGTSHPSPPGFLFGR